MGLRWDAGHAWPRTGGHRHLPFPAGPWGRGDCQRRARRGTRLGREPAYGLRLSPWWLFRGLEGSPKGGRPLSPVSRSHRYGGNEHLPEGKRGGAAEKADQATEKETHRADVRASAQGTGGCVRSSRRELAI